MQTTIFTLNGVTYCQTTNERGETKVTTFVVSEEEMKRMSEEKQKRTEEKQKRAEAKAKEKEKRVEAKAKEKEKRAEAKAKEKQKRAEKVKGIKKRLDVTLGDISGENVTLGGTTMTSNGSQTLTVGEITATRNVIIDFKMTNC
jgi:membrane protein involved in colicin uptake